MLNASLTGSIRFTEDMKAILRHLEVRDREIAHMLRAADAFQRELAAMTEMAARMQGWLNGLRLPCFDDPIR